MENKIITFAHVVIFLIAILFILSWFSLNKNLNTAVNKLEQIKLQLDSAQRTISNVVKNLSDINIAAQQTENQLKFLNHQRDSLSVAFTDKIYTDKWMLQKYVAQLAINRAQHDSIALLINKFQ